MRDKASQIQRRGMKTGMKKNPQAPGGETIVRGKLSERGVERTDPQASGVKTIVRDKATQVRGMTETIRKRGME